MSLKSALAGQSLRNKLIGKINAIDKLSEGEKTVVAIRTRRAVYEEVLEDLNKLLE